ncbi:MAG: terminase small subunit [Oscillospiraceae bacterium]
MGTHEQKKAFCAAYLRTMNPERAAAEAGFPDGTALLEDGSVRKLLSKMRETRQGEICREDAIRRLCELAFGRANDGARLALREAGNVEGLDLAAVAELKTKSDGSVEIKFIDRVRALEVLCGLLGENGGQALDFFQALEDAGETE